MLHNSEITGILRDKTMDDKFIYNCYDNIKKILFVDKYHSEFYKSPQVFEPTSKII